MNAVDRLYSIDNKRIQKSVNLDDSLYEDLKDLIFNKYDATISELINVCIENYIAKNKPSYYAKPDNETVTYRSIIIRKNNYEALQEMHKETGISFTRLLNSAIKEFLDNE